MLTIGKIAKEAEVTVDTIRHYIDIGLLSPQRDRNNGYQLFDPKDVYRIQFIKRAQDLGFTLKELKQICADANKGDSPCPQIRKIIEAHIEENRRKIKTMQELQRRMEEALKGWKNLPNGVPNGHSICHLIDNL